MDNETDAKEKIILAAVELLNETDDPGKITVKQIADRADVGVGLINYHFQTKERLINKAVASIIDKIASKMQKPGGLTFADPVQKLKAMVIQVSDFAIEHSKFHRIVVNYELQNGTFTAPMRYVPILREIYGNGKDEIELRIIALQLLAPMQVVQLNPSAFKLYTGIDAGDKIQRDKFINTLIDNLVT